MDMALQRYEVPSVMGTTYIFTDNPPAGASLVQDYQYKQPVNKPSLEQRIEVLEKEVSDINNRLGIKTNSNSVDLDAASKLLDSLDSSAAAKVTNEIDNTNNGVNNAATVAAEPVTPSSSGSAPVPSADDIAKQRGDLMS